MSSETLSHKIDFTELRNTVEIPYRDMIFKFGTQR